MSSRLPVRASCRTCISVPADRATNTVPTGLPRSSPSGPARPVTATAMSAPVSSRTPIAIARATGADTAPHSVSSDPGTWSTCSFTPLV